MNRLKLLAVLLLTCQLGFAPACVTTQVPVTETYYETEYRQEPYTTTEQYEAKTPHMTNLIQLDGSKWQIPPLLYLFNKSEEDGITWSSDLSQFPSTKTIRLNPTGKNHRLAITASADVDPYSVCKSYKIEMMVLNGRDPQAIALGFRPDEPLLSKARFGQSVVILAEWWYCSLTWWDSSFFLKETKPAAITSLSDYDEPNKNIYYLYGDKGPVIENAVRTLLKAGYQSPRSTIVKVVPIKGESITTDFDIDEIMKTDKWALFYIGSYPMPVKMKLTMNIDYVYDIIEMKTRQVAKYREVPIQVEKQRTVMKPTKMPFWEGILGK